MICQLVKAVVDRNRVLTIARTQQIQRCPTRKATNPKLKGATCTPTVTKMVQIPMYRAISLQTNVSATTALPIAAAGLMKKATRALHAAIEPEFRLFAHPMLQTKLPNEYWPAAVSSRQLTPE